MPYLRYNDSYSNTNQHEFMTSDEIAKIFKVSEFSVRRWVAEGKLKGLKIGKAYRFTHKDIDNFINNSKNERQ